LCKPARCKPFSKTCLPKMGCKPFKKKKREHEWKKHEKED